MKNYLLNIVIAAALVSCGDSLDQTPLSSLAQGNLPATDADAIALVNSVYQVNVGKSTAFGYMTDLVTETTISGENPNGGGGLLGLLKWDATNSYIVGMWSDLYKGITNANDVVDNVLGNSKISASIQQRVVGEAQFLRAYYLNYAVQFWGEVPIVLHNSEGTGVSRQPIDDVYTQIVTDLTEAAAKLPASYGNSDLGRATSGAAWALLSKVYLTWGQVSPTLTDAQRKEKFNLAVEAANNVTGYELEEEFLANWDNNNRNGKESIFATQHNTGSAADGTGGNHLCHCAFSSGFSDALPHVVPANRDIEDSYEEGDQRKDGSFADSLYNDKTGKYYHFVLPRFRKYIDASDANGSSNNRNINRTILRYAEVLLVKAEAINERDHQPNSEAYEAINQVRRRAFKSFPVTQPSAHDLPAGLDYAGFTKALRQEREWEFVYEQKHWLDLVRWRILVKTIKNSTVAQDPQYNKQTISFAHYRYPIPQAQREINPEGLWQNWGYDGYDESKTGSNPYADFE